MNMNSQPEPDHSGQPFSQPEQRRSSYIGLIVAGLGLLALLYFTLDRAPNDAVDTSSNAETTAEADAGAEKARRKELIAYLQQNPDDEFAHFQLAQLIQERAPFQALENYSHITEQNPHYFEAQEAVANIAQAQNLPEKAKPALMKLIREYPEEPRYQQQLARLLYETGDYQRALPYAVRSIELGQKQAADYLLVAEILRRAGRTSEMIAPLKEALFLEPDSYDAHQNLAYASLYTGDLKTAEREANWCLKQQPQSSTMLRYLAMIERSRGNRQQALAYIDQALKREPHDIENLLLKADLLIYQRQGQQAYDLLKPFYSEHQQDRRYISALARAAGSIGKREEALKLQQQNQALIKAEDLKPSSLQSESVQERSSSRKQ